MFQKPTNATAADYPQQVARLIDTAADGPPLRNFIRNGDFQVPQRGTSIAGIVASQYTLDGWATLNTAGTTTVSQQAFAIGQTAVPGNPKYFMRIQRTVAAGVANGAIAHRIENPERLSGKTITIGFSSECTSGAKQFAIQLRMAGGAVWTADPADQLFTAPLAWGQTKLTFTLPALSAAPAGSSMDVYVSELSGFSTFTLELADFQLELGNEATGFERLNLTDQMRWAQRYFWKSFPFATAPAQNVGSQAGVIGYIALVGGGTQYNGVNVWFPVQMRAIPTITFYNPGAANAKWRNFNLAADSSTSAAATNFASENGFVAQNQQVAGDLASHSIGIHATASAEI